MRRTLAILALTLLAVAAFGTARLAGAQSISADQLKQALLDTTDLPDFTQQTEMASAGDGGLRSVFRTFVSAPPTGVAQGTVLVDSLVTVDDPATVSIFRDAAANGALLQMVFGSQIQGQPTQNFRTTGPLGIGDSDQSAQFDATIGGATLNFLVDSFTHGALISIVAYADFGSGAAPSTTRLTGYAKQQNDKLTALGY